jgi:hypothetical protein
MILSTISSTDSSRCCEIVSRMRPSPNSSSTFATLPHISPSEKTLRQYVLGEVPEDARLALEEKLVIDPGAFDALAIVEDELTEEYLEGTLPAHQRQAFESGFLSLGSNRRLAELTAALKEQAAGSLAPGKPEPRTSLEWWLPGRWQPALVGAMAVTCVLSLLGNLSLLQDRTSLQGRVNQLHARQEVDNVEHMRLLTQIKQDLQTQLKEMQTATSRAVEGSRRTAAFPPIRTPVRTEVSREPIAPRVFALTAGLPRGDGRLDRVSVSPHAFIVRLKLELPGNPYPLYRAALTDAEGDETWTVSKLRSESVGTLAVIFIDLPVTLLTRGDYQIKVSGQPRGEPAEPIGTFSFRVVSQ